MRRHTPSLSCLLAFEASARHQSFTRAADDLCVTQGAVSKLIKTLEEELGLLLFVRETRIASASLRIPHSFMEWDRKL